MSYRFGLQFKICNASTYSWVIEKGIKGCFDNIEINHSRSVKDVQVKTRIYVQWTGDFLRKSTPLCKYYYVQFHAGNLSHDDVKGLLIYKGKIQDKKRKN